MSSAPLPASPWRGIQIPRPLQQLFDRFPLRTYDANALPERSRRLTSSDLPTLYVFCTDEDARLGLPSYNPGCLKWQTLLRLAKVRFRILPSTNHASPTGALPFLLPPRSSSSASPPPVPIPSSKLAAYALQHCRNTNDGNRPTLAELPDESHARSQAYLALINLHLRHAWLHALYLDGDGDGDAGRGALLRRLYAAPASSSRAVQAALVRQLRRAAAEQIATSSGLGVGLGVGVGGGGGGGAADADLLDEEAVYAAARDALSALAALLAESGTGWFFGAEAPTEFDAALFSYTHLMMEFMSGDGGGSRGEEEEEEKKQRGGGVALGEMVRAAGTGELARHRRRMLDAAWPGWDGKTRG